MIHREKKDVSTFHHGSVSKINFIFTSGTESEWLLLMVASLRAVGVFPTLALAHVLDGEGGDWL